MNVIEELRTIPQAAPIVDLIETVMNLSEETLNNQSVEMIIESVKESIEGTNRAATINSIHNEYRRNGYTIEMVKEEAANTLNAFEQIKTNLDLTEFKEKIIVAVFDEMASIVNEAAETYYAEDVRIYFERCHENAKIPSYANYGDAGADIYAPEDITIPARSYGTIVKTGLKMAIPYGWQFEMRPRSGMSAKTKIRISNTPGTIDAGYRNEVGVIIDNFSSKPYEIKAGDRIAQMVLMPVYTFNATEIDDITKINGNRGGGFGSTGA